MHAFVRGEMAREIGAQHVNDECRSLPCDKQGNLHLFCHCQQCGQWLLTIGHDHDWWFEFDYPVDAACDSFIVCCGLQIGNFAFPQYLHAVRMDIVEIAHQIRTGTGHAHRHLIKPALCRSQPSNPLPVQTGAKGLEQDISADDGGFHGKQENELTDYGAIHAPGMRLRFCRTRQACGIPVRCRG